MPLNNYTADGEVWYKSVGLEALSGLTLYRDDRLCCEGASVCVGFSRGLPTDCYAPYLRGEGERMSYGYGEGRERRYPRFPYSRKPKTNWMALSIIFAAAILLVGNIGYREYEKYQARAALKRLQKTIGPHIEELQRNVSAAEEELRRIPPICSNCKDRGYTDCKRCDGRGWFGSRRCSQCRGKGRFECRYCKGLRGR